MKSSRGFSLVEILVVLAVIIALTTIALWSLGSMSERLLLRSAVSDIAFVLEAQKAKAVSGTGGVAQGVFFNASSYTEFAGSEYDEDEDDNFTHSLDSRLVLSTDIIGEESIIFSRITGATGDSVTVTVSLANDATRFRTVVVGLGGDIAYGE